MDPPSPAPSTLERHIAQFLEAEQAGRKIDRDELLARHPELADSLKSFFANHDRMRGLANGSLSESPTLPPSPVADVVGNALGGVPVAVDAPTLAPVKSGTVQEEPTLPPDSAVGAACRAASSDPAQSGPPPSRPAGGTYQNTVRYFGDYELLEEIARGGMGVVYKARQVNLNRIVALKMILAGQLASKDDVQRFYTEAEAAANLDHPGIVPIFEVGQHEGQHYFSMGFVEGQSLAARVAAGPLPPQEAAELTKKIAEAIAYAHSKGVIHRDLKPANILLQTKDEGGRMKDEKEKTRESGSSFILHPSSFIPKVTDFGLAKKIETESGLTHTGAILGTPSYMPPEQAAGKTVGALADVYSLGAILYCLLTGRPPFQAASPLDTLLQVLGQEPIAPRQLNPGVPRDLETIALKCLEKDPARRYPDASGLAADLGRYLNHEPIQARPSTVWERSFKWARRRPAVTSLAAAILVTLVGGAAISTYFAFQARAQATEALRNERLARTEKDRADAKAEEARLYLYSADMNLAQMNWEAGNLRAMQNLLRRYSEQGQDKLMDRDVRGWEWWHQSRLLHSYLRKLQDPTTSNCTAYHPDGKRLATGGGGGLSLWDVETGQRQWTAAASTVRALAFDAEGQKIATCGEHSMIVWNAATGKPLTEAVNQGGAWAVAFHPGGKYVATASANPDAIHVWDSASGELLHKLGEKQGGGFYGVGFSPDGKYLAGGGFNGQVFIWSVNNSFELLGIQRLGDVVESLQFSPDGQQLAVATRSETHFLTVPDCKPIRKFPGYARRIAFSPDGLQAAISTDINITIWELTAGAKIRDFTPHVGMVADVAWSPSGQRLATAGRQDYEVKIWDHLDDRTPLEFRHGFHLSELAFSEDGAIVATAGRDAMVKLWKASTGQHVRTLVGLEGWQNIETKLALSRDGRRIAVCGMYGITFYEADTGKMLWQKGTEFASFDVAFHPREEVLAAAGRDGTVRIWNGSDGHLVRELQGAHQSPSFGMCLDFDPDGERLASMDHFGAVVLWRFSSGQVERRWGVPIQTMCERTIDFSPDGRLIAVPAEYDITIFEVQSGKPRKTLVGHHGAVSGLAFDPSGTRLASAAENIKIWDITSGQELRTLKGVGAVAFSFDGQRLIGGSAQGASLWDARPLEGDLLVDREALGLLAYVRRKSPSGDAAESTVSGLDTNIYRWIKGRLSGDPAERAVARIPGVSDEVRARALLMLKSEP